MRRLLEWSRVHLGMTPQSIRIMYRRGPKMSTAHVLPAGTDYQLYVEDLIANVQVPISKIEVYRGDELVYQRDLPMRGG